MRWPRPLLLVSAVCLCATVGCKAGAVGGVIEPERHTGAEAMEEELVCSDDARRVEPLTVDWESSDRADLEVAMREGLVVTAYDCNSFRVLEECRVRGGYSFAGVSRKEEVVQINGVGELRANLPAGRVNFAAYVERGSSIDVALVTVGKYRTSAGHITQAELEGDCEGATHFLKSAMVGAFALGTGTKGDVGTVAEVFDLAQAGASSRSEHRAIDRDGELEACSGSDPYSERPPGQCQALVRVELVALSPAETQNVPQELVVKCPEGFVFDGAKCSEAAAAPAYECDPQDADECRAQCEAGSAESCFHAGVALEGDDSSSYFQRACEMNLPEGCGRVGVMLEERARGCASAEQETAVCQDDTEQDQGELVSQAQELADRACAGGDSSSCFLFGTALMTGQGMYEADPDRGRRLLERAAELGNPQAAPALAWMIYRGGETQAAEILRSDCDRGNGASCALLGGLLTQCEDGRAPGMGRTDVELCEHFPAPNPEVGVEMFARACKNGYPGPCAVAARRVLEGRGVGKDPARAVGLLELGCPSGRGSCLLLGDLYEKGKAIGRDPERAFTVYSEACERNQSEACFRAGRVAGELGRSSEQEVAWKNGCRLSGRLSCDGLTNLYKNAGRTDDLFQLHGQVCKRTRDREYCGAYTSMGGQLDEGFKSVARSQDASDNQF